MKRLIYILLLITSVSCSIKDKFSPEFIEFRNDLISKEMDKQREEFRKLSSKEKSLLYYYKFSTDLREQELTKAEKRFIRKLRNICTPEFYDNGPMDEQTEQNILNEMQELGWNEIEAFKYTMTYMTVREFNSATK